MLLPLLPPRHPQRLRRPGARQPPPPRATPGSARQAPQVARVPRAGRAALGALLHAAHARHAPGAQPGAPRASSAAPGRRHAAPPPPHLPADAWHGPAHPGACLALPAALAPRGGRGPPSDGPGAPAPTQRDDAQGRWPGDGPGDGPPDGPVGRELDERVPPDGVRPVPGRQACMGEQPRHALGRGLLRAQAAGQLGLTARWLVQEGVHQVPAALALMALCPGQHSHARIVETGGRSVVRSPPPRLA